MYLLIAGDEKYTLYSEVLKRVKKIIEGQDYSTITILELGDDKFDKLVRKLATELNIKTKTYKIEWEMYGLQAAYKRNQQVAAKATNAIFFWKGDKEDHVKKLINTCEENNVKSRIIRVVIENEQQHQTENHPPHQG